MTFPILPSNSPATGYNLDRSLRFRASASASLSRTPATATNRQKFTYSGWVKRGSLGSVQTLMSVYADSINFCWIRFLANDTLDIGNYSANVLVLSVITTQVFRDPSAWYHIVVAMDTTQATAANRLKVYVNGVQVTSFGTATYPAQNSNLYWNYNVITRLGRSDYPGFPNQFDGYSAELNYVDGQQLTPSSFGDTNALTGVWQPARYTGTYGTNGFYLPFTDNSALTTSSNVGLGKDFSGNANYWVTNNISITAGALYDSMTDVPTLTSATAANYPVLNPLNSYAGSLQQANLFIGSLGFGVYAPAISSFVVSSGKWYAEFTIKLLQYVSVGIVTPQINGLNSFQLGALASTWGYLNNGLLYTNNATSSYGSSYTVNDVIGVALDLDANTLTFYKNNVSQGVAVTGLSGSYAIALSTYEADVYANFGQRPFTYTPPTGFVALNAFNLPDSTIVKGNTLMDATLYTGNGSSQSIVNAAGFKPDLVWVKGRSGATDHALYDSVRGTTKQLESNTTDAETTQATGLTAFGSAGFTVGALAQMNTSAATYVGWQWQAGQGSSSSNTNGSITSTVSVNPSAGFSVITYTGNSVSGATVGHGLGVAPTFWVIKRRDFSGSWKALSTVTGSVLMGELNTQTTWASPGAPMTTAPTSSVITLDASGDRNGSGQTYVIYAFTPIAGFSYIGYFNGNGSTNGPFVYTGFRPKFTLSKDIEGGSYWAMMDSSRSPFNVASALLNADLSGAESTSAIYDYLSNGIKLRSGTNNQNNHKHIMISFAENPFKNSLAR